MSKPDRTRLLDSRYLSWFRLSQCRLRVDCINYCPENKS